MPRKAPAKRPSRTVKRPASPKRSTDRPKRAAKSGGTRTKPAARTAATRDPVRLLTGGNPQIAKGEGDAPVQAYIAAMPGWKRDVGRRLDALIVRALPDVEKAVKWNSPFYGVGGRRWFLSFHTFTNYVKVAFFDGGDLRPLPPVGGTGANATTRYLHVHGGDAIDEAQLAAWVRQAAKLPGWVV